SEGWICDRTGHRSSAMVARYHRQARTFTELNLGALTPLDVAIPELAPDATAAPPSPPDAAPSGGPEAGPKGGGRSRVAPGRAAQVGETASGEGGIRTRGTLPYTRFPVVHLRPLGHLSQKNPGRAASTPSRGCAACSACAPRARASCGAAAERAGFEPA